MWDGYSFNITYGFKVNICYSLIADKEVLLLHTKVDLVVTLGGMERSFRYVHLL